MDLLSAHYSIELGAKVSTGWQTRDHFDDEECRQHRKWCQQDNHDPNHEMCPKFIFDSNPESLRRV